MGVLLLLLNPFTELFTFDVSVVNAFLLGCLSSGTSYGDARALLAVAGYAPVIVVQGVGW